ncbi:MAG: CHASE2 domain-containing protein, partial [Thiobacillaceae bacterium]
MALNADRIRLLLLLAVFAAAVGVALYAPQLSQGIDLRLHDLGWRLLAATAAPQQEQRLILIDIDERSLAELGPWPWPRARLAELARRLQAAGAAMQIWDVVFDREEADDAVFAAALRAPPAILAAAFAFPGQGEAVATGSLAAAPAGCTPPMVQALGHRAPAAAYAAHAVGHIAPRIDADGRVRAQPAY